jgi:hypothetical protein
MKFVKHFPRYRKGSNRDDSEDSSSSNENPSYMKKKVARISEKQKQHKNEKKFNSKAAE